MSSPGQSILQSVDLRIPYAAWFNKYYSIKLGGFYEAESTTVLKTDGTMNKIKVKTYMATNGKTLAAGFSDEEIAVEPVSTSRLYNMTMGDDYTREVTLCMQGRLSLLNAGSATIPFMSEIAPHASGIQLADTTDQYIVGRATMPIPVGYRGICQVDLLNQRLVV